MPIVNPSDRTMALGSTQPLTKMSITSISWGKGGRYVRLITLPQSCVVVMKSGNLNFLEPSGPLAVAQWLRCCATNRKVAGSIPGGVSGFFIEIKFFRSHCGPGVDSASNRNEYKEYFLRLKGAGA